MKRSALVAGMLFVAAGIAGFVPAFSPNGLLFGIFAVDTGHNLAWIASGILALALCAAGDESARMFFRIIGIVYALVAVLGFLAGRDGQLMGMAINIPDDILHAGIAALALWIGFFSPGRALPPPHRGPDLRGI